MIEPKNIVESYAVFGNPIQHSKSPQIHHSFAKQTNQQMVYTKQLVDIDGFSKAAKTFFSDGGKGLNITVPFKLEAYEFADDLSARALLAGAVNTLSLTAQGKVSGDNTDGIGLVRDMTKNHGWGIGNKNILILGAGGAVRGVLGPLLECQPTRITIANRTVTKAEQLAAHFANLAQSQEVQVSGCGFDKLNGQQFDLVINGTAASLNAQLPPLPNELLGPDVCCYDMMYSAQATVFMQWAQAKGAQQVSDGLGMLVEQAAEAFFLWRGQKPETATIIKSIRKGFSS